LSGEGCFNDNRARNVLLRSSIIFDVCPDYPNLLFLGSPEFLIFAPRCLKNV
jgi:hypothetical protein